MGLAGFCDGDECRSAVSYIRVIINGQGSFYVMSAAFSGETHKKRGIHQVVLKDMSSRLKRQCSHYKKCQVHMQPLKVFSYFTALHPDEG
jgi:hypothetical protein